MELRFITFNSIIYHNLMPWLSENQDHEKFRLMLRKLSSVKPRASGPFFTALPAALGDMGIHSEKKLTDEWLLLSKTKECPEIKAIRSFLQLPDDNPKLIFYTSLIAHTVIACISFLTDSMDEGQTPELRKHRIINFMKAGSDMIIKTRALNPTEDDDRIIIIRLLAGLAVLYAETLERYPEAIEPTILKISKAGIKNILHSTNNMDENTRALYIELAGRYFPIAGEQPLIQPPSVSGKESIRTITSMAGTDQYTDTELLEEMLKMQEEISGFKADLNEGVKKKTPLPEPEDKRIGSAEVCSLLGISKSTLMEHRKKNLYKFTKIGSRYYYSYNEIKEKLKFKKR